MSGWYAFPDLSLNPGSTGTKDDIEAPKTPRRVWATPALGARKKSPGAPGTVNAPAEARRPARVARRSISEEAVEINFGSQSQQ